nr:MAG TPA: hypothetical protein [Siphoviridae sp. ctcOR4]
MSDQPKQYILAIHTTDADSPTYSLPKTYEKCVEEVDKIRGIALYGPGLLDGQAFGFKDSLIFTRHITRVEIQRYIS